MNPQERAKLLASFGWACQVCKGKPDCPANEGKATDIHEVFITRSIVMQWPKERRDEIRHVYNCVPVCNAVNTGSFPFPRWEIIVRQVLIQRYGAQVIQDWIDGLGFKTRFNVLALADHPQGVAEMKENDGE